VFYFFIGVRDCFAIVRWLPAAAGQVVRLANPAKSGQVVPLVRLAKIVLKKCRGQKNKTRSVGLLSEKSPLLSLYVVLKF
jgi:hypothetical protein